MRRSAADGLDLFAEAFFLLGLLVGGDGLVVLGDDAGDDEFVPGIAAEGEDSLFFDLAVSGELALLLAAGVEQEVFVFVALHHALKGGLDAVRRDHVSRRISSEGEYAKETDSEAHSYTWRPD